MSNQWATTPDAKALSSHCREDLVRTAYDGRHGQAAPAMQATLNTASNTLVFADGLQLCLDMDPVGESTTCPTTTEAQPAAIRHIDRTEHASLAQGWRWQDASKTAAQIKLPTGLRAFGTSQPAPSSQLSRVPRCQAPAALKTLQLSFLDMAPALY